MSPSVQMLPLRSPNHPFGGKLGALARDGSSPPAQSKHQHVQHRLCCPPAARLQNWSPLSDECSFRQGAGWQASWRPFERLSIGATTQGVFLVEEGPTGHGELRLACRDLNTTSDGGIQDPESHP